MSRKPHEPTDDTRQTVRMFSSIGTDQEIIARVLGIDAKTLRKWYRDELDIAGAEATAAVGGALYEKALGGDTAAMIFWMKTRAGWKETKVVDQTSSDGTMTPKSAIDVSGLSQETIAELAKLHSED